MSFRELFRFAERADAGWILLAVLASIVNGVSYPIVRRDNVFTSDENNFVFYFVRRMVSRVVLFAWGEVCDVKFLFFHGRANHVNYL